MLTDDYRVRLDAFEGPLDLLLYLIRRSEVDIHDIPIAAIAEQYMGFLSQLERDSRIDIDVAGEFLLMAATLMEVKSRMLASEAGKRASADETVSPGSEDRVTRDGFAGDRTDPRAELVRQLLAYKKFRDAASALETRADDWRRRFPAAGAGIDQASLKEAIDAAASEIEVADLDVIDLVEAFTRISESVNFDRLGDHEVTYDDTPIELHAEDIIERLKGNKTESAGGELPLARVFTGRTRAEMVGLFLAVLDLVRKRKVTFRVERDGDEDGKVVLSLRSEVDEQV